MSREKGSWNLNTVIINQSQNDTEQIPTSLKKNSLSGSKALTAAANNDMSDPVQNRDLHPGDTSGTKKRLMMAARR